MTIFACFRHSWSNSPRPPVCGHNLAAFQCSLLTHRDIKYFHATFYAVPKKTLQDCLILKYTSATAPARPRSRKEPGSKAEKGCSIKYYVKKAVLPPGKKLMVIPVSRDTFLGILQISRDRVQRVCKRHLLTGLAPKNSGVITIKRRFFNQINYLWNNS